MRSVSYFIYSCVFSFLFFFVLVSCDFSTKNPSVADSPVVFEQLDSLAKPYDSFPKLAVFSKRTSEELVSFTDLKQFNQMINHLRNSNAYEQFEQFDTIASVLSLVENNLSEQLSTPQILSRIRLMNLQLSRLSSFDRQKRQQSLYNDTSTKLFNVYNSFILQLNEVHVVVSSEMMLLLENAVNRTKEIDKQFIQDSIVKAKDSIKKLK